MIKYLLAAGTAATILLTPGCLEERVQPSPEFNEDAKILIYDRKENDTEAVIKSSADKQVEGLLYGLTPAHENYY